MVEENLEPTDNTEQNTKQYFKPLSAFGIWFPLVGIAASMLVFLIIVVISTILKVKLDYTVITIASLALYSCWGLWALLGWHKNKLNLKNVYNTKGLKTSTLFFVIVAAFIAQVITVIGSLAVGYLTGKEIEGNANDALPAASDFSVLTVTMLLILTVIAAPVFEEIMFRSLILDGIYNTLSKLKVNSKMSLIFALSLSSILFGMSHVILNIFTGFDVNSLVTLTVTTFFGVYLGYLRIKHQSLTVNTLVHASFNAIAMLFILAAQFAS